ncbi:MAG: LAGLIDADG family homing endonuclease, partial [Chloroflexota bacterium]
LVNVEDLYHGAASLTETVTCEIESLRLKAGRVSKVMDNGIKPVYRLTTALGRQIEATGNHPFYAFSGWQKLEDLKAGDLIAVPRYLPVEGKNEWPEHEVIALGHLLAEGNLCHPHSVYYYNQDMGQVHDFVRAADTFDNVKCTIAMHKGTYSIYAARADRRCESGIFTWAGKLGLLGKNARDKVIPDEVFTLTNPQIGLLISRMWQGDGHIDGTSRAIFYATASEKLARQLQHLLLRFGIISRLRTVTFPYKEERVGYQLFVTGDENLRVFDEQIGCYFLDGIRKQALENILQTQPGRVVGTKDIVPMPIKELVREAKELNGITWTQMNAVAGIAQREFYPSHTATKRGFTRQTIGRLATYLDEPRLRRYAENNIYWDEIVSIEYIGEKQTYDLEIDETHNFVANDILVHNSHAADYGVIAVQTAYLKVNYTAEYMTALLSASAGQTEKVALYVADARSMGIPVLAPEVNASNWDFDIEDIEGKPHIRFGLAAIKNVGEAAIQLIIDERNANGKFKDLNDFARRVDLRAVGKRALECLIKVGAMDCFGDRAALLDSLDRVVSVSNSHFRAVDSGQMSLFGGDTGVSDEIHLEKTSKIERREMLNWERELIGLYISDHPLTEYQQTLAQLVSYFSGQLNEANHEEKVRVAGLVTSVRPYTTKTGKPMGFVTIEDIQGNIELVLFPRTWTQYQSVCTVGAIVLVEGKADQSNPPTKVLVDAVKTEFKMLVSADDASTTLSTGPVTLRPRTEEESPKRPIASPPAPKPVPVTKAVTPQKPVIADAMPAYAVERDVPSTELRTGIPLDDDTPPPPDNFPDGWDNEWQPSFEEASIAARSEPAGQTPALAPGASVAPSAPLRTGNLTYTPRAKAEPPPVESMVDETEAAPGPVKEAPVVIQPITSETIQFPSLYMPLAIEEKDKDHPPRQLTVVLRPTGDKERDKRRIKTLHGILTSYHGRDKFSFQIFENGKGHLIDFPNDTTRLCADLFGRLKKLIGEESWRVEEITFQ